MPSDYVCPDCKKPSQKRVCDACLAKRVKCPGEGCTVRLNPAYDCCPNCSCAIIGCFTIRVKGAKFCEYHNKCIVRRCSNSRVSQKQDYCQRCLDDWEDKAPRCSNTSCKSKKKCEIGTNFCMGCNNLRLDKLNQRKTCSKCKANKIFDAGDSKTTYNYCDKCLCKNDSPARCGNAAADKQRYCQQCIDAKTLCGKVGLYGACPRLKAHKKDSTCLLCCSANKCTKERKRNDDDGSYYEYCPKCHVEFTYHQAVLCASSYDCFQYTADLEGICVDCKKRQPAKLQPSIVIPQQPAAVATANGHPKPTLEVASPATKMMQSVAEMAMMDSPAQKPIAPPLPKQPLLPKSTGQTAPEAPPPVVATNSVGVSLPASFSFSNVVFAQGNGPICVQRPPDGGAVCVVFTN